MDEVFGERQVFRIIVVISLKKQFKSNLKTRNELIHFMSVFFKFIKFKSQLLVKRYRQVIKNLWTSILNEQMY